MKHNELLAKYAKGYKWLNDKKIPEERKNKFIPKWENLLREMNYSVAELEKLGITFNDYEAFECIEIPKELKRIDVEIFLEQHWKITNFDKLVENDKM